MPSSHAWQRNWSEFNSTQAPTLFLWELARHLTTAKAGSNTPSWVWVGITLNKGQGRLEHSIIVSIGMTLDKGQGSLQYAILVWALAKKSTTFRNTTNACVAVTCAIADVIIYMGMWSTNKSPNMCSTLKFTLVQFTPIRQLKKKRHLVLFSNCVTSQTKNWPTEHNAHLNNKNNCSVDSHSKLKNVTH